MKKILFASTVFDDVENGPGTYARYLWDAFKDDRDVEFHLVVPKSRTRHSRIHEAGSPSGSLNLYRAVQNKITSLQAAMGPFDLLHANSAHMLGGFDTQTIPFIAQVNDYEVAESFVQPFITLREKGFKRSLALAWRRYHEERVLKACAMVVTNSDYVRHNIQLHYNLGNTLCNTVYKAVDLTRFRRASNVDSVALGASKQEVCDSSALFHIVFIGSNWEIKGLDYLLEAVRLLVDKGLGLRLSVVGDGTHSHNGVIRNRFQDLESAGIVHYLGRKGRDEMPQILWQADVSVLPSRQEALGVSVLESMAAGVPVVAARVGGIPEILGESEFGLVFPPADIEALASSIEAMSLSEELRIRYIEAGLERVEKFSRTSMVDKIRQLYLELDATSGFEHFQCQAVEASCN